MFGAGFYFFAVDGSGWRRELLLVSGGLFLAIAGFMHVAFLIAMILLVGIILVFDKSARSSWFWICFAAASSCLWGWYIHKLGLGNFLNTPAGHDASPGRLLANVQPIIWFFCFNSLIYAGVVLVFCGLGKSRYALAQMTMSALVTMYFAYPVFRSEVDVVDGVSKLNETARPIFNATGAIYQILLIGFLRWFGELLDEVGFFKAFSKRGPFGPGGGVGLRAGDFRKKLVALISEIQGDGESGSCLWRPPACS